MFLQRDYGVLVRWDGDRATFYFFDNPHHLIRKTARLGQFLRWIELDPAVEWIDKCCCPFSYGMNEADREEIAKRVRVVESRLICTCESLGLRLP